jgi:alpha-methylacyl-CoA racemase
MIDGALAGIRVLDVSGLLPGPYASLLLADMGADVIKIEARLGDLARQVPPMQRQRSAFFLWANRNKRSLGLNLKDARGRELFMDLARESDVVLESFRPGRVDRMGIGPAALRAVNPRLVYCSISGFGQTGPDAGRSGHDATYLARSGILDLSGTEGGPPILPPVAIADMAAGTNAALAIVAGLVGRARTGEGCTIDISLLESALAWVGPSLTAHLAGVPARRGKLGFTGRYPCYNVYRTADGGYVALGVLEPVFWREFCQAIGRSDLVGQQFAEGEAREQLFEALAAAIAARSSDDWAAFFRAHDLPAEVVVDLDAALADPHLVARGAFIVVEHPEESPQVQVQSPLRFGSAGGDPDAPRDSAMPRPAPDLGADTRAILEDVLGLDAPAIDGLFAAKVVFSTDEAARYRMVPGRID